MDSQGNEKLKKRLADTAARGALSHAYIIWGPDNSGKENLALSLAAAIVCTDSENRPCGICRNCMKAFKGNHPDIITIEKQTGKREIYVDQIRRIISDAPVMPNEADKKVYIIYHADSMNANAQNAFLKLLEEPPSHSSFILIGTNPGNFLNTIRSRCVELNTVPEKSTNDFETLDLNTDEIARHIFDLFVKGDKLSLISEVLKAEKLERNLFLDLIDNLYIIAAQALKTEQSKSERMRIYRVLELLQSFVPMRSVNVGTGHIAGILAVKLNTF